MKKHLCYLRAILLSILAAFIIDAVVNFDEYKQGWAAVHYNHEFTHNNKTELPLQIGKATGMIFNFVFDN